MKRNPRALGARQLVIIDECHLLSENSTSQYRTVLNTLAGQSERLRVLGLSATPYRTKGGMLTNQKDAIFTDVAYDLNTQFVRLIEEGYLAPLVTVQTPVSVNLKDVHVRGGDFREDELIKAVGNDALLNQACDVMINEGRDRKSWLVFVSGIQNSENVASKLQQRGINAIDVTSARSEAHNAKALADFRAGRIRCLVSANQLTTGFDAPNVDMIGMLRPTMSASLHVQSLGRGTRPAAGKSDCLVLDFAQNTVRLGPINAPYLSEPSKKKKAAPTEKDRPKEKTCESCGMLIPINTRCCPLCGYERPKDFDLDNLADVQLIAYEQNRPTVARSRVARVFQMVVEEHIARSSKKTLRITFILQSNAKPFKSFFYLGFDNGGQMRRNSCNMWLELGGQIPPPRSFDEAWKRRNELIKPTEIEVIRANHVTNHFDKLVKVYYPPNIEGVNNALKQLRALLPNKTISA